MNDNEKIIEISKELHAIATGGMFYSKDHFDVDRFKRVEELSAELVSLSVEGISKPEVQEIFERYMGYQTPKADTRAVIFNDKDEVLLIRDYDGKWAMPGGWCDYDQTVFSNTIKEAKEEAGLVVEPYRLVAVHDYRKRNNPKSYFSCFRYFVLCKVISGEFTANDETTESRYFALDNLPSDINTHKNNKEQIELCLKAYKAQNWETVVD